MQEKNKFYKPVLYLTIVLTILGGFILYQEISKPQRFSPLSGFVPKAGPVIDFRIFNQKEFQDLILVKTISPPKKFGRNNPFLPYKLTTSTWQQSMPASTSTNFVATTSTAKLFHQ